MPTFSHLVKQRCQMYAVVIKASQTLRHSKQVAVCDVILDHTRLRTSRTYANVPKTLPLISSEHESLSLPISRSIFDVFECLIYEMASTFSDKDNCDTHLYEDSQQMPYLTQRS